MLEFLRQVFGAEELAHIPGEGGRIDHAEARIGDSIFLLFDSWFVIDTPALPRVYVEDADVVFERMVEAGPTL